MKSPATSGLKPVRTLIYGSCVSRDTFEYLGKDFALGTYVARQSLISAGNSSSETLKRLHPIASPFQKRVVEGDLRGSLYSTLDARAGNTDLVIIDLIDERNGVVEMGDGQYATRLSEFWNSGGREISANRPQLELGSDEHFAEWSTGVRRFVGELLRHELFDRTVVINAPWAELTDAEESFEMPAWMRPAAEANLLYQRYYDYLRDLGLTTITVPEHLVRTSETHQWGISPFHYTADTYRHIADELRKFVLSLNAPRRYEGLPRRNAAQWGSFTRLDSSEEYAEVEVASGLFTLVHNGLPLDMMIEDNGSATTLVSFSAALGKAQVDPPVFTGRAASADLGLNRVFMSDPGLLCSTDLGLAWYLGTREVNLTDVIADMVRAIQARIGAEHLVFFGMSGGGFASLNVSQRIRGSLAVPVNPQTRILDYAQIHWQAMAEACFGVHGEDSARAILEAHPRADQRTVYADGFENTVIYVQNSGDSHLQMHLIPWFESINWGDRAFLLLEDWGRGHIPPNPDVLRTMLSSLATVSGDWRELAEIWRAQLSPTREWVREESGR